LWDLGVQVLGGVDFDPCSAHHFAKAPAYMWENGHTAPWPSESRIILNPPGSLTSEFWLRAMDHSGPVLWVGFSVEQLATLQRPGVKHSWWGPSNYPHCVLRKRVKFMLPDGTESKRPSHANFVALLDTAMSDCYVNRFIDTFSPLGTLVIP
jgi:hypothetical protein